MSVRARIASVTTVVVFVISLLFCGWALAGLFAGVVAALDGLALIGDRNARD